MLLQSLGNDTTKNRNAYIDGVEDAYLATYENTSAGAYPAHQAREAIEELFETI